MASGNQELVEYLGQFYRDFYRDEIGQLAQRYPDERRSLYIDWRDLARFDSDLADDYISRPEQVREAAEESLRMYDLPVDVSLGQAHVRIRNLPENTDIRDIHSGDINTLTEITGIVRETEDPGPQVEEGAFECQRCGTLTYVPQSIPFELQRPIECQGCERKGPFTIDYDRSTFVDAQRLAVQDGASGSNEPPESLEIHLKDDIVGRYPVGRDVTVTGVLRIRQGESDSRRFDVFIEAHSIIDDSSVNVFEEFDQGYFDLPSEGALNSDSLEQFIETSRAVLNRHDSLDEFSTQTKVITPFVAVLGWDIFAPEVQMEYPQEDYEVGKRVDYALLNDSGTPVVVVEAKQEGTILEPHFSQLREYIRILGSRWGVLTNGDRYVVLRSDDDSEQPSEVKEIDCRLEELQNHEETLSLLAKPHYYESG